LPTPVTEVERKILLVDDYRHSLEGLRAAFVAVGWLVETAGDSWQAVRRIKDGGFDVAVIDLDLPPVHGVAVSGWDLVRICRAVNPEVPIVVVSADGGPETRTLGEQLTVAKVLVKPIDMAELKLTVRGEHPRGGHIMLGWIWASVIVGLMVLEIWL